MSGLYGSLFLSFLEYQNLRDQLFAVVIILILQLVIFTGRYLSIAYLIRDVFYLGALFISLKLYFLFIKKNNKMKYYIRSLVLGFFYGPINALFISMIFIINTRGTLPPMIFVYNRAIEGALIGLGIGLGVDVYIHNRGHFDNLLKIKTA
jgi:hypothetical protein